MYFNECPHCGSHLDPGERCECLEEQAQEQQMIQNQIYLDSTSGQYRFRIEKEEQKSA